ncbi:MAG: heavy metal translocating P-type ATPase [Thermomicrobiales bacterium]
MSVNMPVSAEALDPRAAANLVAERAHDAPPPAPAPTPSKPRAGEEEEETWWDKWQLVVAAVGCWSFLIAGVLVEHFTGHTLVVTGLFIMAYIFGGTFATIGALQDLFLHRTVNVDLLMVTAAIGAAFVGGWAEGAVLLGLFSSSNALEHFALGKTQRAVRSLMELSPQVATLVSETGEMVVPVEELKVGDTVLVRPGERVSVDGTVLSGHTSIDQAAITGESVPVSKSVGDTVFAATINQSGAIKVRVDRQQQESTLAKIVQFVEDAQENKSRTQRFTDAFEGRYAIGVILFAAIMAIVPPFFFGKPWDESFYKAMTLLVVASPCALVISTPASTLSALANAARHGILFKGSNHLEDAGVVETIAFDKTGTLTVGKPALTDVVVLDPEWSEAEALQLTASAERLSEHPLAAAIVRGAQERGLPLSEPREFRAISGKGILANVSGQELAIGNDAMFAEFGAPVTDQALAEANRLRGEGKTAMFVGDARGVRAIVAVADTIRPAAPAAIAELKRIGVKNIVMLTGDNQTVAQAIGDQLGITSVQADLLPADKLVVIERLKKEGMVAMIGDGVNDAPALATANLGIAMGGAGTDVALETADVVLMADDLTRLPYAIELSRKTRRIIKQNLTFALLVIVTLVLFALFVGIPLPLGVVGHEGSTVIVVLNGLRLLRSLDKT